MSVAELLERAGSALFGLHWQGDLSRTLRVDRRTVSRWAIGAQEPRPGIVIEVRELVRQRAAELAEVDRALTEWVDGRQSGDR
jgi:hypothetical protein